MRAAEGGTRVRCYLSRGTGVHAIDRDEAVRIFRDLAPQQETEPGETLLWIDVVRPGEAEAEFLRHELGLHPLAVEDCLRGRQRPKLDRYPGYFFLVMYATSVNLQRGRMAMHELHVFLGSSFLITVHEHDATEIAEVVASWRARPERFRDAGAVAHGLLDAVIDNYFPILEHFSERLAELEEEVFTESPERYIQKAIHLRHEMVLLRRVLAPERDVLSSLVRRDLPFLRPELIPYFQDVHDHVLRVTEEIDAFRELLNGLIEIQATNSSRQLNQTMQTLTVWAIILMSMALVAGIYGMNFAVMPELRWPFGYYAALSFMAAIGLVLLLVFRRKGWL
jgi:magnesium transporter